MKKAPLDVVWWLVSRASGVLALVLISLAVLMGLAMAARVLPRGRVTRAVLRVHEHIALAGLTAIVVHGLALLGDTWLHPGLAGIAVPFVLPYRPTFTGLGIVAGYLAVLVGPSFYARRRLGTRWWRKLHRVSALVWALGAVHTLGAGSDASTLWLRAVVVAPIAPLAYIGVLRVFRALERRPAKTARPGRATATGPAASRARAPIRPRPEAAAAAAAPGEARRAAAQPGKHRSALT
ncbi:MAG: methionine sulfoxide reductase heme-binding subunit [Solirubrobacteraceae bacterium]|nr:methionine sulfoxide reductase heme-binding subunit [Solirubrobacteraceae bacterium]